MTFDELYYKCKDKGTARAFATKGGISVRMLNFLLQGKRYPSLYVWQAFLKARPDLKDEIDTWFYENLLCSY